MSGCFIYIYIYIYIYIHTCSHGFQMIKCLMVCWNGHPGFHFLSRIAVDTAPIANDMVLELFCDMMSALANVSSHHFCTRYTHSTVIKGMWCTRNGMGFGYNANKWFLLRCDTDKFMQSVTTHTKCQFQRYPKTSVIEIMYDLSYTAGPGWEISCISDVNWGIGHPITVYLHITVTYYFRQHRSLRRYVKLRVPLAPGMSGTFNILDNTVIYTILPFCVDTHTVIGR